MAFSLAVIIMLGLLSDHLFRRFKLPGLVGMLLIGVLAGPYALQLISPEMMILTRQINTRLYGIDMLYDMHGKN